MTLNITPKRKAILQRIQDGAGPLFDSDFRGYEAAQLRKFRQHDLLFGGTFHGLILTDKGRRALHAGEGWGGV